MLYFVVFKLQKGNEINLNEILNKKAIWKLQNIPIWTWYC